MPDFTITTDRRTFTITADDAGHAERIVMGRERPVSVPPAPQPAEERTGPFGGLVPTAAWLAWYHEHRPALVEQRLDFGRETLIEIKESLMPTLDDLPPGTRVVRSDAPEDGVGVVVLPDEVEQQIHHDGFVWVDFWQASCGHPHDRSHISDYSPSELQIVDRT